MKAQLKRIAAAAALLFATAGPSRAVQLQTMLQGYLTNSSGTPITTSQTVDFKLFQGGAAGTAGSGTLVYEESGSVTPAPSGVFNYLLGSGTPTTGALTPSSFDTPQPVFVEISVGGQVLLPRIQLTGMPYAAIAGLAESLPPTAVIVVASGTINGTLTVNGGIYATSVNAKHLGDGSQLQGVTAAAVAAANVQGGALNPAVTVNASSLVNGPLPASMLPTSGIAGAAPIGAMIPYAGTKEPSGWIECDGRALPQSGTAAASWGTFDPSLLFQAISTVWGSPGSGQFTIPDMRGMLPRGWNHGKAGSWSDPDAGGRSAQYASGATGDAIGSYQRDQMPDHTHALTMNSFGAGTSNWATIGSLAVGPTLGINAITGTETRAKNASVMYLIRVQ